MQSLIRAAWIVTLSSVLGSPAKADDEKVFSGPQPGEKLSPFKVVGVFDALAGKEVDFVAEAKEKPTLLIFVHSVTRPSAAVTRALSCWAESRAKDGLQHYIVWLAPDRNEAEQFLNRARKSLGVKSPLGIALDGAEGPGAYGLNRKVILTILVAKEGKVTANFAWVQPSVTETPQVAAAVVQLIGGKAPTLEDLNQLAFPGR
jgi:hypothetical protein